MDNFLEKAAGLELNFFASKMEKYIDENKKRFDQTDNKLICKFNEIYSNLPNVKTSYNDLENDYVCAGKENDISKDDLEKLKICLKDMIPWRKGPFNLFGINVESEWNSSLKWNRFADHINLKDKRILDIGSSNGYYLFKMLGLGAKLAVGVEPFIPYYYQFKTIKKYINKDNIFTFPTGFEEIPVMEEFYDYVFCMGVLYHRKSPLEMLCSIRETLVKKGVLILENLIIEGNDNIALIPEKRYAMMNNVHFVPTLNTIKVWLRKAGFNNIEVINVAKTTIKEQRKTDWTFAKSLEDFLDPDDENKTIEGYPAPIRAVIKAEAF